MRRFSSPAMVRRLIQIFFAVICLAAGVRLYAFCAWATGRSDVYVSRPPVGEGFLPISALLGLKQLLLAGVWDRVHPAGLTILLAALLLAFALRKGFCGYVCPIGLVSDLLSTAGRRLGLGFRVPAGLDTALRGLKFVIMGILLWLFLFTMDLAGTQAFLTAQYNITADGRMLAFFLEPSRTTLVIFAVLAGLGLLFRNAWCRWLCPYGALLGLAAMAGPVAVHRDAEICSGCGRCEKACPSAIRITRKQSMRGPECIGCAQCLGACPVDGALSVRAMGKEIPWRSLGIGAAAMMLGAWLAGMAFGVWQSGLPEGMVRALYAGVLG